MRQIQKHTWIKVVSKVVFRYRFWWSSVYMNLCLSISIINYLCLFQLTQSKETQGDKNRHVLRKLHSIDDSDFDSFLDHLKTTQPKVSERINNVKAQVHVNRRSSETISEDDFGNDFDGILDTTLCDKGFQLFVHNMLYDWIAYPVHVYLLA
jgi:hypothetical protein